MRVLCNPVSTARHKATLPLSLLASGAALAGVRDDEIANAPFLAGHGVNCELRALQWLVAYRRPDATGF